MISSPNEEPQKDKNSTSNGEAESADSTGAAYGHVPVLLQESLSHLNIRPGLTYVDATAGGGGHLRAVLSALNGTGRAIGIDRDDRSLAKLKADLDQRALLLHSNYSEIKSVLAENGISTIDGGVLADLGVSSMQIDDAERGFSFLKDGPLDMRMDPSQHFTAEQLVNTYSEKELADVIFNYGEERHARGIARRIIEKRPITTTSQLADIVTSVYRRKQGGKRSRDEIHPATRTFQAVRIAVNDELKSLEKFLLDTLSILAPGARFVVITFHSLEDRIVKQIFRQAATGCICPPRQPVCTCHHQPELLIITRKPVTANEKEVLANIRSRSAKLRAGERLL